MLLLLLLKYYLLAFGVLECVNERGGGDDAASLPIKVDFHLIDMW